MNLRRNELSQRKRGTKFGVDGPDYDDGAYEGVEAGAAGYEMSIETGEPPANEGDLQSMHAEVSGVHTDDVMTRKSRVPGGDITAPKYLLDEAARVASARDPNADDPFKKFRNPTIAERESEYMKRRHRRALSPPRSNNTLVPVAVEKSEPRTLTTEIDPAEAAKAAAAALSRQMKAAAVGDSDGGALPIDEKPPPVIVPGVIPVSNNLPPTSSAPSAPPRKRRRWDVRPDNDEKMTDTKSSEPSTTKQDNRKPPIAPTNTAGMSTITGASTTTTTATPGTARLSRWDTSAPLPTSAVTRSRWDLPAAGSATPGSKRSRWDATPALVSGTPAVSGGATPMIGATPEARLAARWQADVDRRNAPLTDADLDVLPKEGYKILKPPPGYVPLRPPPRLYTTGGATPGLSQTPLYSLPAEGGMKRDALGIPAKMPESLQGLDMKPEDYTNFAEVLNKDVADDDQVPTEEQHKRQIMRLLLKIKNGSPAVRKVAMRQITDRARLYGADALFDQILPLLMSKALEDQERHLYVKVIDRVLHKLDDLVKPHVHKILVVISPSLIDEDYYARVEGREIISNLAKVAGLPTMIANMRPDIDHQDEFVRNTTARAFAVVATALGIPSMLVFLKAVCSSTKCWEARHTGQKIIQQIANMMGVAVLPHLQALIDITESGLDDEHGKVRLISALAVAALAEACAPYGIEFFDGVIKSLWDGVKVLRGKTLAAFLKAIGYVIPLMEEDYANYFAKEMNFILTREYRSSDDEMKLVVLAVVKQCVGCDGIEPEYVRTEMCPDFYPCFWVRRMALERRHFRAVVETTVEIAGKVGGSEVLGHLVDGLKNESEPFRRMVVDCVEKIASGRGLDDVDPRLEERLVDGLLFAFQEPGISGDNPVVLKALAVVIQKLGTRAKPYLKQIAAIVKWRLNNKNAKVREVSADLIALIAPTMKICDEEELMGHMGEILYEYLGEEFPDVLGSILSALGAIVEVIGLEQMKPPIRDLLPRLTPILKNRHEKVQENCITLVGRIAERGASYVGSKEWMRICFELLELLKAPRKAIRKSAVSTYGYIAKAIGPANVLGTLLNNLKVQERTQRVCTTVAIAIVAETCNPYTVLPSLMNEYRIPELNVQNGVLKSLSFLFEYIGDQAADYIYAVTPVLEDALIDRDLVHRQTACTAVGHLAIGVRGLGREDALMHLLNHVWPNAFETSPHVINAVMSAVQGCTVALGPAVIMNYVIQGLFHPARKVRIVYWRIYNALYQYKQDALVACYPEVDTQDLDCEDEGVMEDPYRREELFLMV